MLGDSDHGHKPVSTGNDHLGPVVRANSDRARSIVTIRIQLALEDIGALQHEDK